MDDFFDQTCLLTCTPRVNRFLLFFITLTLIFDVSRYIQMKSISEIESTHQDLSNDAIEISNGRQKHFFKQLSDFSKTHFWFYTSFRYFLE